MSKEASKKYVEIRSNIEKSISPYITVRIPLPEGVEKEAFLRLEDDSEFIRSLRKEVRKWLQRKTSH